MSEDEDARRRVQGRSPSFPFISLRRAVEQACKFDKHSRGHAVRVAIACSAWGYRSGSSSGLQTVAALKAFGFVSDAGSGEERKVQLTDFSRRLFRSPPAEIEQRLLQEAALKPKLIKEFWERWGASRPPDDECKWTLVDEKGFTDDAAGKFLAVYDNTIVYAGLASSVILPGQESDTENNIFGDPDEHEDAVSSSHRYQPQAGVRPHGTRQDLISSHARTAPERELTHGPLSPESGFRIFVSGPFGPREIRRLIRTLELYQEFMDEEEADHSRTRGDTDQHMSKEPLTDTQPEEARKEDVFS